jgi:hypothetical protein
MLEIHNYDPWKYAGSNPTVKTWGSDGDKEALTTWVDDVEQWAKQHNLLICKFGMGITGRLPLTYSVTLYLPLLFLLLLLLIRLWRVRLHRRTNGSYGA